MNRALNAYLKQKIIGDFTKTLWKVDEQVKTEIKPGLAAKFSELMLKSKNPPVKKT